MSRIETIYPTERVSLREVGLRDGAPAREKDSINRGQATLGA